MVKKYLKYNIMMVIFFAIYYLIIFYVSRNENFSMFDLSMNMLSEILGMVLSVYIFNEIIVYREQGSKLLKTQQLVEELSRLIENLDNAFLYPYKIYGGIDNINAYNPKDFNVIYEKINITKNTLNKTPPIPWYLYFHFQGKSLFRKCENIYTHYADVIDQDLAKELSYLTNDSEIITGLINIKSIFETELILKKNRSHNLGSYLAMPTKRDLESFSKLHLLYKKTTARLDRFIIFKRRFTLGTSVIFIILSITIPILFYVSGEYSQFISSAIWGGFFLAYSIYKVFKSK